MAIYYVSSGDLKSKETVAGSYMDAAKKAIYMCVEGTMLGILTEVKKKGSSSDDNRFISTQKIMELLELEYKDMRKEDDSAG